MVNYGTVGAHQINKFLWDRAKKDLAPEFADYTTTGKPGFNLVPFIPAQQIPQFNNLAGGPPFIVYSYTMSGVGNDTWGLREQIVYVVYDVNESRLRKIQGYFQHLLRHIDDSAREVNRFLGNASEFDFKSILVLGGTGPEGVAEEGGRQGAALTIMANYSRDAPLDNKPLDSSF